MARVKPSLHVIDDHTGFRNAIFLRSKSADGIWSAFVACWASIYVGFPSRIRSDQESGVNSTLCRDLVTGHSIQLEFSGVASHNSMGKIEQAHAPLRRIFRILSEKHPKLSASIRLRYPVKELNDTAGDKGLVPSMLVFGVIPSIYNSGAHLCEQEDRFDAMKRAREEAATITAENRVNRALRANVPPSARYTLKTGQAVMVYSEKQRKWIKDLTIVRTGDKLVWVNDGKIIIKLSRTQVIPQTDDRYQKNITDLLR